LPQTVRYFGVDGECDYRAEQIVAAWPGRLGFVLRCPSGTFDVRTQLVGEHWVSTALAALAGADAVGVDMAAAVRELARVPPFPGRFQPVKVPSGAIFLRDDYGGAFVTTKKALRVMETATSKRRWLLISDFTYSSMNRRKRLKYLAERSRSAADVVVLIGDQAAWGRRRVIEAGFPDDNVHAFSTIREAADLFQRELTTGDLVLLKGRVTQHLARIYFAQLGPVECWKEYCPKTMLCDICWELGMKPADMELGKLVVPDEATGEDGGRKRKSSSPVRHQAPNELRVSR
jgi:UDP-N-acetylmuramoyl-tripeptide--D-alanyl-D-alanine ligase